ncbi:hypothetical protein [Sphingobacterium corticibacterium]|uniref:Uncharacterized protein n=1 Tax=Sphingobacterium corticibacterium TaxID=2484746 RepID=A0A4Q6XZV9_9SPHI|nr:hypothetical protein [Sphingobacterium corticibacterium]RZF62196.1 hypothetical protein EWE74_05155 [Sphingobacterium corticibacterium]
MNKLFELTEQGDSETFLIGEEFKLTESTPSSYNILRVIIGNVIITNIGTESSTSIFENFLAKWYEFSEEKSFEENVAKILNESLETSDLKLFFFDRRYNLKNKDFFNRLENEFCNFLTYETKGSHTTSFVFLYRILEVVSFSFPLIYASKTYDFKHTYGILKEMFDSNNGNSKGELGFLKSAIQVIFKESELMNTSVDIEFDETLEKSEKIYTAIRNVIKDQNIFHGDTIENSKISICFGQVSSFIISLRNRFFHLFNRGDKNLESHEIVDPDYFFSKINKQLFSWICVVYIEILKFLIGEHERNIH